MRIEPRRETLIHEGEYSFVNCMFRLDFHLYFVDI